MLNISMVKSVVKIWNSFEIKSMKYELQILISNIQTYFAIGRKADLVRRRLNKYNKSRILP